MGTETGEHLFRLIQIHTYSVKLNNPLMGTETRRGLIFEPLAIPHELN